jgi:outer membrane protein assembly factor BamB
MLSMQRALWVQGLSLCWMLAASLAWGQEWTRFRGPNGGGESEATTVPVRWGNEDYNFRIALPGKGHSSPVVWEGRVYLLSADAEQSSLHVLSVDADTGRILWDRTFPLHEYPKHAFNSFASSTPTVDQHHLYAAWADPQKISVVAMDHSGRTVWQQDLGPYVARHGFGTSPMLHGDLVILACSQQGVQLEGKDPGESFVVALDRQTGQVRWKTARRSADVSYSTPCVYQPDGGPAELILCSTAEGIYSLDPQSGRENWSVPVFKMRTVSSPIVVAGLIFGSTGSGGGGNYLVALRPGTPPQEAYRIDRQAPYVPVSVARGDLAFLWSDAGVVTCVHAPDGEVIWRERVGGSFFSSPVRAADKLYGVSRDGEVVVLAAQRTYRLLGRSQLGEPTRSTPAVAIGRMFLRTESHLMSIGG